MKKQSKLVIITSLVVTFVLMLGLITYTSFKEEVSGNETKLTGNLPVGGLPGRIGPETKIVKELRYWCGDVEHYLEQNNRWLGKDRADLLEVFLPEEGWELIGTDGKVVKMVKLEEDFCRKHRDYRHLGMRQGKLAIYQGPLGFSQTLLQVEDINVKDLPIKLQYKLKQAQLFNRQPQDVRQDLLRSLEFPNDPALNAYLDNLDEFLPD